VMNFRPVLFVLGILVLLLGLVMLIPAAIDFLAGDPTWKAFISSFLISIFVGGALILANRGEIGSLNLRQAFLLTSTSWLVLAALAALPLNFADLNLSYTDSFFEAMSGITTTGSTVIVGLDSAPHGLLMWRALLQWLGGIGIIVVAVAIFPDLRVGGMQLFRSESSDTLEKALPRSAQIALYIGLVYLVLTMICSLALYGAGMSLFESIAHAMTTIATGGFSTSDQSVGHFNSAVIDWIIVVFMIIGSMPFVLYLEILRRRIGLFVKDSQIRVFLGILAISVTTVAVWQSFDNSTAADTIRSSAFNVISIITGTGYSTADYGLWGSFPVAAFLVFIFIGGCAGSTSCGIKIFRYQVIFETARTHINNIWQPHTISVPRYNGRSIPDSVMDAVMTFVFVFLLIFCLLTAALTLMGLDFVTAISGAGAAIANVGPGLGQVIGPGGTYAPLPDAAKWVLSAGMLLGRLELFTILVLFTPAFWRG